MRPIKQVKNFKTLTENKIQAFLFIKALGMVLNYIGETGIRLFYICDVVMNTIDLSQLVFFTKTTTSTKLTNGMSNVVCHLDVFNWRNIRRMLLDTFKTPYAAANVQIELSLKKMRRNEIINNYNTRLKNIFQKLCASITAGKSKDTAC